MKKEMVDLILKDLPNQTAGVLRDYIDRSTDLERKNEDLVKLVAKNEKVNKLSQEEIEDLKNKIQKLEGKAQAVKTQNEQNQKTLLDIERRERDMQLTLAQMDVQSAEKRADDIKELTALLVRNTTFRKRTMDSVPVVRQNFTGQYDNGGNYSQMPTGDYIDHETKVVVTEETEE